MTYLKDIKMLNNDYLRGYTEALKNVESFLSQRIEYLEGLEKTGILDPNENNTDDFEEVKDYIEQVRENYKKLVKDLNAKT